jgi:hypothetical protein
MCVCRTVEGQVTLQGVQVCRSALHDKKPFLHIVDQLLQMWTCPLEDNSQLQAAAGAHGHD